MRVVVASAMLIVALTVGLIVVASLSFIPVPVSVPAEPPRAESAPEAAAERGTRPEAHPDGAVELPAGANARLGTTLLRHGDGLVFAAFLPGGDSLLTASKDKTARLWSVATGRELRRFARAVDPTVPGRDGSRGAGEASTGQAAANAPVVVAAMAPDGRRVALADDRSVCVWETASGKQLRELEAPKAIVQLGFSPDGSSLVGVGTDRSVTAWDLETGRAKSLLSALAAGEEAQALPNGPFGVTALAPDLKFIAWNQLDLKAMGSSLRLTDLATGGEPPGAARQGEIPPALAFSADGRSLLWAGNDQNVHVTEIATGKETLKTERADPAGAISGLTPSADGKALAVGRIVLGRPEVRVEVWDLPARKRLHSLAMPDSPEQPLIVRFSATVTRVRALAGARAFSPDSRTLAVGLGDAAAIRLFDLGAGRELPPPGDGHRATIEQVGVTPGGGEVHTFARGDGIFSWDPAGGRRRGHVPLPEDAEAVTFSADGTRVAAVVGWATVVVCDVPSGTIIRSFDARRLGLEDTPDPFQGAGKGISALALSPDGKALATRRVMSTDVRVWDVTTGEGLRTLVQSAAPAEAANAKLAAGEASGVSTPGLAFSPDGAYLVGAGAKWQLCLWEVADGRAVWEAVLPARSNAVRFAFSPDGRCLGVLDVEGGVALYEVASGRLRGRLGPADASVRKGTFAVNIAGVSVPALSGFPGGLAFSPDSRRVAASSGTPGIRVWDVLTGEEVGQFQGHAGRVSCLGFTPDGRRLISGSSDTTALVWDATRQAGPRASSGRPLEAHELDALWSDLATADAARAFEALRKLAAAPRQTAIYLGTHLRPATTPEPGRVEGLVTALRDPKLAVRQEAERGLEALGERALPWLREGLRGDPPLALRQRVERLIARASGPVPAGDLIRELRAIELLERIGGDAAHGVLKVMSEGAPDARPTREARAALARSDAARPPMP